MDLPGYSHNADYTLYKKFLSMTGNVKIETNEVAIYLKKKRNLPALLTATITVVKIKEFNRNI